MLGAYQQLASLNLQGLNNLLISQSTAAWDSQPSPKLSCVAKGNRKDSPPQTSHPQLKVLKELEPSQTREAIEFQALKVQSSSQSTSRNPLHMLKEKKCHLAKSTSICFPTLPACRIHQKILISKSYSSPQPLKEHQLNPGASQGHIRHSTTISPFLHL